MQRKTVLLLFGGESSEHDVSISSARNVFSAMDENNYEVILSYIDRNGRWYTLDSFDELDDIRDLVRIIPSLGTQSFIMLPSMEQLKVDVIFPVLHGQNGEDGTVQGLARLLHIPIVGSDIDASVIAIDKDLTKRIVSQKDIPTVPYEVHIGGDPLPNFGKLTIKLGNPLFVKPAHLGSSVGVRKVFDQLSLMDALESAHGYDDKVLIEQAIVGRELEIAVLGNVPTFQMSGVGEIQPDGEFYTFESKYDEASKTKVIIPADLPDEIVTQLQDMASTAFRAIEGRGLARIDFFLSDSGQLYLNEINTLPGFTNISMYPKLWQHQGMKYNKLIDTLIELALHKKGDL
jgi:D-alanine-D-alanine ligase